MSVEFCKLCADVARDTKFLHNLEDCRPHYQKVLDYILAHPEERDELASALCGGSPRAEASIYLMQFLMETLKWPEAIAVAEARLNDGGNHFLDCEYRRLLEIYRVA